jgi:hypothetical protein
VLGIAVLVGGPADVGVQAVVPSSLFRISSRALTTAARRDARVAWAVAEELNRRLHDTLQQTAVNVEPASDPARAPFTESLDVIGDGSLVLLATPGHTAGSLSLLIRRGTRPPLLVVERARLGVAFLGDGRRAAETAYRHGQQGAAWPQHPPGLSKGLTPVARLGYEVVRS